MIVAFPFAFEHHHPDDPVTVSDIGDHLAVAWLEDVERHLDAWKQDEIREREDRNYFRQIGHGKTHTRDIDKTRQAIATHAVLSLRLFCFPSMDAIRVRAFASLQFRWDYLSNYRIKRTVRCVL